MEQAELLQYGECICIGLLDGKWTKMLESDRRVYSSEGLSPTVRVVTGGGKELKVEDNKRRYRKYTPRECWRLMGFDDESFDRASKVNSNSQLYKQAGNSIVVPVLEAIFKNMLGGNE